MITKIFTDVPLTILFICVLICLIILITLVVKGADRNSMQKVAIDLLSPDDYTTFLIEQSESPYNKDKLERGYDRNLAEKYITLCTWMELRKQYGDRLISFTLLDKIPMYVEIPTTLRIGVKLRGSDGETDNIALRIHFPAIEEMLDKLHLTPDVDEKVPQNKPKAKNIDTDKEIETEKPYYRLSDYTRR